MRGSVGCYLVKWGHVESPEHVLLWREHLDALLQLFIQVLLDTWEVRFLEKMSDFADPSRVCEVPYYVVL